MFGFIFLSTVMKCETKNECLMCSVLLISLFHFFSIFSFFLTKFFLVLLTIITHIVFLIFNFIFKLNSVTTDINLIWLRDYLVTNDATLAVNTGEIFKITLQLMNHDVIEGGNIINVPISVHWFVFTEVIFNDINLNLSKYKIDQ